MASEHYNKGFDVSNIMPRYREIIEPDEPGGKYATINIVP